MSAYPEIQARPAGVSNPMQAIKPGTTVVRTATDTTQQTAVLAESLVRLIADIDCYVAFGADPTATNASMRLAAGVPEWFVIEPAHKIAVLRAGSTDGSLWITPAATV